MNDPEILSLFEPLWDEAQAESIEVVRPLLAHYTSMQVFESILKENEIWFSNPLFMNDYEEVRFGVLQGERLVRESEEINQLLGTERANIFRHAFDYCYNSFANDHVLDMYVFCFSEHKMDDDDGLLSMWRGYGSNGNGIAIVFNTANVTFMHGSPLVIAKVHYGTTEARITRLAKMISDCMHIIVKSSIPDESLYLAAHCLFERIKFYSLYTKHIGFQEEREWRMVYIAGNDPERRLESMFNYWIGPEGIQPKLRLKIEPVEGVISDGISLPNIVDRIVLGPTVSTPMAKATVLRMLDKLQKPELKDRIRTSSIPFRAIR